MRAEHDRYRAAPAPGRYRPRHAAPEPGRPPEATSPAPQPDPRPKARLAGLEGPRGIGCLCVIAVHVAVHFTPDVLAATRIDFLGQALTFFFVLSGFLLYLPYVKRLAAGGPRPETPTYLIHRFRRIFPAYLLIFLVVNFVLRASYVVNPVTVSWDSADAGTGTITDPLALLAQLTLAQSYFPSTLQTGINPAWSLSTEFGFYLTLPVLAWALFAAARRLPGVPPLRLALVPGIVLVATGIICNTIVAVLQHSDPAYSGLMGYWGPNWVAVLSRSFPALADTFGFGMLAAVGYVALTRSAAKGVRTLHLQLAAAGAMLILTAASLVVFIVRPHNLATVFATASAMLIVFVTAALARGERSAIAAVTDWRPIRYVGIVSLSTYLWHYPVLILLERTGIEIPDSPAGLLAGFLLVGVFSVLLGSLTYRFVERPAMEQSSPGVLRSAFSRSKGTARAPELG